MNKYTNLLIAAGALLSYHAPVVGAPNSDCVGTQLSKTFNSGALWSFCWRIEDREGLVLSQVHYQAPGSIYRRVLGEASLSQIEAVFDDGATDPVYITTWAGLGGNNIEDLDQTDCPGGDLHSANSKQVLCTRTRKAGYLYKYTTQRQTEVFDINTFSQVGPRNYQIRWSFHENGTIEPAVGLSGILPAVGESSSQYGWPVAANGDIGTGFTDHYQWRLDFDLNDTPWNDMVEEISSVPTADRLRKEKVVRTLTNETGRNLNPDYKTFWRVMDASVTHPGIGRISYELVPMQYDQSGGNSRGESWLQNDFYFTAYKSCERHAADNRPASCGQNTAQFINNQEDMVGQDVVVWYKQSHHYLPRSEDTNRIATRWNSFKLIPRDWNATNPY